MAHPRFLLGGIAAAFLAILSTAAAYGAGVTVITHGFQLDRRPAAWISAMAAAAAGRSGIPWSDVTWYHIEIRDSAHPTVTAFIKLAGPDPAVSPTGEVFVTVDWSENSGLDPLATSSEIVAQLCVNSLKEQRPGLGGPLAALPIHLVGHSRGASVVSEVARLLGESGIWVDHLTTLDPHPIDTARGITYGDAEIVVRENIVFADNFWRKDVIWNPIDVNGKPVVSAFDRRLSEISLSWSGYPFEHSDVHLWYFGTINTSADANNGEHTVPASWYDETLPRDRSGYFFSRIGGGVEDRRVRGATGLSYQHGGPVSVNREPCVNSQEIPRLCRGTPEV